MFSNPFILAIVDYLNGEIDQSLCSIALVNSGKDISPTAEMGLMRLISTLNCPGFHTSQETVEVHNYLC